MLGEGPGAAENPIEGIVGQSVVLSALLRDLNDYSPTPWRKRKYPPSCFSQSSSIGWGSSSGEVEIKCAPVSIRMTNRWTYVSDVFIYFEKHL